MPANIQSGAYEKKPWHREGVVTGKTMTAKEAIVIAGMNWKVRIEQTYLKDGTEALAFATRREDNEIVLGSVGSRYQVIQNEDAFASIDRIIGKGMAQVNSAFALGKGERICVSCRIPGDLGPKEDRLEKFVIVTNSHDGKSSMTWLATLISCVCENTLNMALGGFSDKKGCRIKHAGDVKEKMFDAEEFMRSVDERLTQNAKEFIKLQSFKITDTEFKNFVLKLVPPPKGAKDLSEVPTRTQNIWAKVLDHWVRGDGMNLKTRKNTAYGALNAVAEYVDYSRATRITQEDRLFQGKTGIDPVSSRKTDSLLFGSGAIMKQNAANLVQEIVLLSENKTTVEEQKKQDEFKSLADLVDF